MPTEKDYIVDFEITYQSRNEGTRYKTQRPF